MSDWGRCVKAGWVGVLCAVMVVPAEGAVRHEKPLTQQERVLQALDRFTFGPRPGDVAAVESMGLSRWFEGQLHPERIDDSAFGVEVGQFPAMGLMDAELMRRFPSQQRIRQMSKQGEALPGDPVERAIYADAEYVYEAKVKKDAATGAVGVLPVSVGTDDVGFGPDEMAGVLRLAPEARLGRLVGMSPAEMMAFREAVKGKDRVRLVEGLTPVQREAVEAMVESPERVVDEEVTETRLMRDIGSQRQLLAVMTEFWLNHFNVYLRKNGVEPYLLPEYQREVILPHALGRFEDLLVATAESPAMLMYLDNWESIGPDSKAAGRADQRAKMQPDAKAAKRADKGINENYGRELMELHTLGVNGGYTQQDVIEVAKCFTGWTIDRPYGGDGGRGKVMDTAAPGEFVFEPNRHEPGSKVVLGHTIPEGGMNEGLEVLHILATSPATARFISQELAVRFVSDHPPTALVNRMAATFLKSDGDISAVLMTMFRSKEFWSPEVYRAKVKTPLEFLTSAVRASGAAVTNPVPLVQAMDRLGMPVYGMQTPNGYGWTADDWVSSNGLISRMNFALVLSGNRVTGVKTDWAGVLGGDGSSPSAATEKELEVMVLDEPATARTRAAVMEEFTNPAAQADAEAGFVGQGGARLVRARGVESPLDTMAGLLLGSPEFQRR